MTKAFQPEQPARYLFESLPAWSRRKDDAVERDLTAVSGQTETLVFPRSALRSRVLREYHGFVSTRYYEIDMRVSRLRGHAEGGSKRPVRPSIPSTTPCRKKVTLRAFPCSHSIILSKSVKVTRIRPAQ